MPLTKLILGFLSVCSFIKVFFDLLPQRQLLPSHKFLPCCVAAKRGDDVIKPHVLPSYAHTRLFMGVCVGRNDSGSFEMPRVARTTEREGSTFWNRRPTLFIFIHYLVSFGWNSVWFSPSQFLRYRQWVRASFCVWGSDQTWRGSVSYCDESVVVMW